MDKTDTHKPAGEITLLLNQLRDGDSAARTDLIALVYRDLRNMAGRIMRGERPDHTLQPSALVNEAYMNMMGGANGTWKDRAHFFGTAATAMRHVLTDYARKRGASKRGGDIAHVSVDDAFCVAPGRLEELLVMENALDRLGEHDSRALQVVVYRIYGGMSNDEIAEVTGYSERTVKRDWNYGQAWLKGDLRPATSNPEKAPGKAKSAAASE